MKKFEYLTVNKHLDDLELNVLGAKGWDLVTHVLSIFSINKTKEYYIFKRENKI